MCGYLQLSADWFPPSEASIKRSVIRKLIYNLLNDSCKKTSPSTCSNGHPSTSVYPENDIEQVQHIELLSAHCSPAKNVMGDASCPDTDTEDGIELLRSSSSAHFDKEGLILPEFLEQTTHSMSLPENGEPVHMHNVTSSKLLFASSPTEVFLSPCLIITQIAFAKMYLEILVLFVNFWISA